MVKTWLFIIINSGKFSFLPKKEMSEGDMKWQYIAPAITPKWDRDKITMETQVTDGKINLKGNFVSREKPKCTDYILYLNVNNPIAIEAKDNNYSISHGLQRAMSYAQMIDLPFAYSSMVMALQNMADVDDFDFICHVAFDKKPLTRKERANNVKKRDFLSKYSGVTKEVLEALLDKYMNTGIYEIEKTEILKLDPFQKLGKPAKIAGYFGGKAGYLQAVKELEEAIYADEAV